MKIDSVQSQRRQAIGDSQFYRDVIAGLSSTPKYLHSKYFYDTDGDILFQQIMKSPEYYLTNCELEILSEQTDSINQEFTKRFTDFDLVELGAGDASKSLYLLRDLLSKNIRFSYQPIDISAHAIALLDTTLPKKLPGLKMEGLNGEYFQMLNEIKGRSNRSKVVLLLGGNLGNMLPDQAKNFCVELRQNLQPGDLVLIGFDLKKHPQIILDAYNDKAGITKAFNLNLLKRINRELGAKFDVSKFDHYATYDPANGSCKSYLISLAQQKLTIGEDDVLFQKDEYISMEVSQKYSASQIEHFAAETGFKHLSSFYDSKKWFVDVLWECA